MILDEQHNLDKAKENVYILERGLLKMITIWLLETKTKLFLICLTQLRRFTANFPVSSAVFVKWYAKNTKNKLDWKMYEK